MRNPPPLTNADPAYFALTIHCSVLMDRAIECADSQRDSDAGEVLLDLMRSFANEENFDIRDVLLMDEKTQCVAFGLIHHYIRTGRLGPADFQAALGKLGEYQDGRPDTGRLLPRF